MKTRPAIISYYLLFLIVGFQLDCAPTISYSGINLSRQPKSSNYPINVFDVGQRVPRNCVILGVINTGDTGLSMDCSYNAVIEYIKKKARAVGGDAISILQVQKPDLGSTCYRIIANVIGVTDIGNWPRISITENEFRAYLDSNEKSIDDIEGIWNINSQGSVRNIHTGEQRNYKEQSSYRIAIKKEFKYPGYEYAGYILESTTPEWELGFF